MKRWFKILWPSVIIGLTLVTISVALLIYMFGFGIHTKIMVMIAGAWIGGWVCHPIQIAREKRFRNV